MATQCFAAGAVVERCPDTGDVVSYHVQVNVNGLLEIPVNKPCMEQMFSTTHDIDLTKVKLITVTKPPGTKVLVLGKVLVGLEYIADGPDQKVHFAHWEVPFSALVKDNDGSLLPLDFNLDDYVVNVCVEHEEYTRVDCRTIAKEIVLLIWLQRKDN